MYSTEYYLPIKSEVTHVYLETSHRHHLESRKQGRKKCILYDFIYIKF
jgi:hypothetical protein